MNREGFADSVSGKAGAGEEILGLRGHV